MDVKTKTEPMTKRKAAELRRADKADQERLKELYRQARIADGESEDMVQYYVKNVDRIVELGKWLYPIMKYKVETRFCFGYHASVHGSDYDDARGAADMAAKSEVRFLRSNLESWDRDRDCLAVPEWRGGTPAYCAIPCRSGSRNVYIYEMRNLWPYDHQEYLDFVNDGRPDHMEVRPRDLKDICGFTLTDEEVLKVADALARSRQAFEKKVKAYLKRYGMSKVRTWTYWADE